MLTYKQNVKAILECIFAGYKDELIENACNRICTLKDSEKQEPKTWSFDDAREDAVNILKDQIDLYEWQAEDINAMVNPKRYNEYQNIIHSLKMAIEALKAEPCEDCVSREDVKAIIFKIEDNYLKDRKNHPINYGTLLDIILKLTDLPSVTPKLPDDKGEISDGYHTFNQLYHQRAEQYYLQR